MLPTSPFTRQQALDLGLTDRQWRGLAQDRAVREVYRGLFVAADLPDTLDLRFDIMRAVLPPDVSVARRAAAWLQGHDFLDVRGWPGTPPVEVVTKRAARRPQHGLVTAHVARDLLPSDLMTLNGLHMTTPLRTVADLIRHLSRSDALVAIDSYLSSGLVSREELQKSLIRWKKRRGVRQAYEMLELADPLSQSGGESRTRLRILDAGLPRPELQIPVADAWGNERYYLDLGWRRWRLALEYDGEEHHGPEHADHDAQRRSWIARRGWTIRVYRKEHIFTASRVFEEDVWALVRLARAGQLEPGFSDAPLPESA
jgi:hypothetical protein